MIIQLQPQAQVMQKLLCPQQVKDAASYRKATWTIEISSGSKEYIYNVLTKEFICVQRGNNGTDRLELIRRWFLVEEGFNEFEYANQIKKLFRLLNTRKNGISNYTIFTTTACNARCYYCFERNHTTRNMSSQTCDQIVEFINRNCSDQLVSIRWFGGEPLMNHRAIDAICDGLHSKGISYRSTITTNGYLFTERLVERAVMNWKLTKAQITLDGTEFNYNAIKNYIYPNTNPFVIVLNNIDRLVNSGVKVVVRLNVSLKNVDDLCNLVTLIHDRFGENKLLQISVCTIFDLRNDENKNSLGRGVDRIQDEVFKYNLGMAYEHFKKNRVNHCQADDDGHSIVIFPGGDIGWCEHAFGGPYVGNVKELNISKESLPHCCHEYAVFDRCHKCALFPDCLKLLSCDSNNTCLEFQAHYEIRQIQDTMRKEILRYET